MKNTCFVVVIMCTTFLFTSNSYSQKTHPKLKVSLKNDKHLFIAEINGKYGIINQNQEIVRPFNYTEMDLTDNKLIITNVNREIYGLIDKKGKEIFKPKFDYIDYISGGLLRLKLKEKWGVCDEKGKIIIPVIYDNIKDFSEGLICAELKGKYGFKNKLGQTIIPFKYDDASNFSEALAFVKIKGKYGFIDKSNRIVISCKYEEANDFSEGLALVQKGQKKFFINRKEKIIHIEKIYDWISNFSERRAAVMINNKWGYIDRYGKEVIPLIYDNNYGEEFQSNFNEERALVVNSVGKWGFIDKSGNEIIPLIYDYAEPFFNGKSLVRIDVDCFFINKEGLRIPQVNTNSQGLDYEELNARWGIKDIDGKIVIPVKYESILIVK